MARLLAPHADVSLVLPSGSSVPADELRHFYSVFRLPIEPLRRSMRSAMRYLPALVRSGRSLAGILKAEDVHALVINDFYLPHGWIARRFGYRGRIATWVRFDPTRFPKPLSRLWLAAAAASSDTVVAVSEFVRSRLPIRLGAQVVYDTIDLDLPVGRAPGEHRDVVCVGNFMPDKGQGHALEVFRRVAGHFPGVRLVLQGGDMGLAKNRAFRAELARRARAYGLETRVVLRDYDPDLRPLFASAAVMLNLSQSETFSLTCLEASQAGVPVVSFRSGGPAEIIQDGVTGYLCEVGDLDCVTDRTTGLLASPPKAAAMGQAAAKRVSERFGTAEYAAFVRAILALEPLT